MMDPRRLSGRDTSVFENRILHAARNETIPHAMKVLMSRGLNLGPSALAVPVAALVSVKAAVIALIGAAAIAGLAVELKYATTFVAADHPESHDAEAMVSLERGEPSARVEGVAVPAAPVSEPGMLTPRPVSHRHPADFQEEIGIIDRARTALAANAPAKALAVLREYDARCPSGTFAPEAMVLRIEALHASGDKTSARTLLRRFLNTHPKSPFAEHLATVVGSER